MPWTPQTILQEIVDQDLLNTQSNADAMLAVHEKVLASVDPPLQDVVHRHDVARVTTTGA